MREAADADCGEVGAREALRCGTGSRVPRLSRVGSGHQPIELGAEPRVLADPQFASDIADGVLTGAGGTRPRARAS